MNFLELCKATARESGSIAGLPSFTTVNGASGRVEKLVNWVRDAWVNIQNERTDWLFRTATFDKPLSIGVNSYTGASFALEVASWLPDTATSFSMTLYDPALGQGDETYLQQRSWDVWRSQYDRGAQVSNRPTIWAQAPDGSLCIGPKPDKAYTLRGTYRRKAQRLTLDGDTPLVPEDFHNAIIGRALLLMAESDEAFEVLRAKAATHATVYSAMVLDQTPQVYAISDGG